MRSFLVIGLGRFGSSVARELASLGQEVLALDEDEENVQHIADDVTQAICGDAKEESVLRSVGARNFDCCIVAVGTDMEAVSYTHLISVRADRQSHPAACRYGDAGIRW